MSKVDQYNALVRENLNIFSYYVYDDDQKAVEAAQEYIQKLQQIVDRLRRIVDDGEPPQQVRSMLDAMKLPKDELAFLVGEFCQWINNDEGCPARDCLEFPCEYRCIRKAECEENLKNGDLDEFGMKKQQDNGFFAELCDGDQQGCWVEYYLWCYRNGVNPLNGKKEER